VRDDQVLGFLWSGVLSDLVLDLCFGELSFSVLARWDNDYDVQSGDYRHRLRFGGLTGLNLINDIEFPWNYAELSEIRLSQVHGTELFQFEMYLWSEDATMKGTFKEFTLDGAPVPIEPVMAQY
jgi:hypothetical protein